MIAARPARSGRVLRFVGLFVLLLPVLGASGDAAACACCPEVPQLTGRILRISGAGAPNALVASAAMLPLYFSSPEDAVTVATELMRRDDWPTLARYYDLSRSKIPREELTSGRFFVRTNPPATFHPGLPWRYRHPFTPGFTFKEASAVAEVGVVLVVVGIEIDEGGGRVRRGFSEFKLRQSSAGYRILPPQEGSSLE